MVSEIDGHPVENELQFEMIEPKRQFEIASPVNPRVRYPEKMSMGADSIDFGFMYSEHKMMCMQTTSSGLLDHTGRDYPISFSMNLLRRELVIEFPHAVPIENGSSITNYRVDEIRFLVPFRDLATIWEVDEARDKRSLVFSLRSPPQFFRKTQYVEKTHDEGRYWTDFKAWARQTEIDNPNQPRATNAITFKNERAVIDIGRWTTYKINFLGMMTRRDIYNKIHDALVDYNVEIFRPGSFSVIPKNKASVWDVIDKPSKPQKDNWLSELANDVLQLSWPIRYQLESCISLGRINERSITREFILELLKISARSEREALIKMELAVDSSKPRFYDPMEIFHLPIPRETYSRRLPKHCIMQRSATVTPTTMYLSAPAPEMSNRVLRQYTEHADRFLRVRFTDEKNEGRVHATTDEKNLKVFNRVYQCLRYGIKIGDRHFEYLASGNSQFRENGAYFFAPTKYLKTEDVRKSMGTLDNIKSISKYASRLGQCFSTTRAIRHANLKAIEIDDVEYKGHNFTDGVGKITQYVASLIASELRLPNTGQGVPSVFQFRMGGAKGVVSVWSDIKDMREMQLRPSQWKFMAPWQGIEIIRWSAFSAARLNRQLINVLKSLRVPDSIYMEKLDAEIGRLNMAMKDDTEALAMLQQHVDANQTTLDIACVIFDGFIQAKDPFAVSMLRLWRSWSLKLLKEKAAIPVKDGAFVLGCTDETATLEGWVEGAIGRAGSDRESRKKALPQIFIQVPDSKNPGKYKVIEEICIVARNPSLHPGDIRVVQAVDLPQLHHIRDAVVFSQKGDRDVPNMCSGGDLDGDDFVVIWDQALIPPSSEWDYPAMDFTGPKGEEVANVTMPDVARFFVQFMQKDTLRTIANAHQANADLLDFGVRSDRCEYTVSSLQRP